MSLCTASSHVTREERNEKVGNFDQKNCCADFVGLSDNTDGEFSTLSTTS